MHLYTSTTPFSDTYRGELCYIVTGSANGSDIPDVITVPCAGRWRYFMVYTNTGNNDKGPVLDFGEVKVFGKQILTI